MTQTLPDAPGGHAVRVEDVPDPQVGERASRRTYTARYKLEVLAEYERLDKAGKGALLRREGPVHLADQCLAGAAGQGRPGGIGGRGSGAEAGRPSGAGERAAGGGERRAMIETCG